MEINPRFWGSLAVDIYSGVDFPNLIIDETFGIKGKKAENNRKVGILVRWLFLGDILWFLTHPNKIKAFKKFIEFKNQKFDILDYKDPLPIVGAMLEGFMSLFKKTRKKHAFNRGWNF